MYLINLLDFVKISIVLKAKHILPSNYLSILTCSPSMFLTVKSWRLDGAAALTENSLSVGLYNKILINI